MSNQYVGEIRIFPFNFAPVGWAFCDGQLMPISQNTALFSLLGTQFGGDGKSTFALPNLQGNFAMHFGDGAGLTPREIGETGGESAVTLNVNEIPSHSHPVLCSGEANAISPASTVFGSPGRGKPPAYAGASEPFATMSAAAVANSGGNQAHNNMPPFLTLNCCVALQGIFPPRS